ncbi:MAG: hypothetical protein ACKV2T_29185 [Kofleriaceae bacterium]
MRATKHILFAIALIGIVGAFLPLIQIRSHGVPIDVTPKELSFGFEKGHQLLDYKLPSFAEKRLPADIRSTREDIRLVAEAMKWAMALFIPIALMMLFAILAQWKGRLTRGAASIVVLLGVISAASWFVLRFALDYGLEEIALKRTTIVLAPGAHFLLFAGVGAVVVGVLGVFRPEPAPAAASPMFRPPVPPPPGPAPT